MSRFHDVFLDTSKLTREQLTTFGEELCVTQRGINWWIGDAARCAKYVLRLGDNYSQVFPPWVSPGLIQRCEAVASAYPTEAERNPLATWSVHMQHAREPNRVALVQASVEAGRTSDEERAHKTATATRWALCVDVNYFVHRFWFSGAGVEAASSVASWVQRTVERLREKGLTDVACCLDSTTNHRKELTVGWERKYKDRPAKDPELAHQLNHVQELIRAAGFACVSIDGMEADDVMASFAAQFPGRVTLLTQDKDCRQCLSEKCNMLLDVEWRLDEHSANHVPEYKWLSAKQHTESTGISPQQWVEYQCLMGDNTDGISGAAGIGEKGAADLVKQFGRVSACIEAAKAGHPDIKPSKRSALIAFESTAEVTRKLVTLRTDLELPGTTRL